jgi:hypothetical protein
MTVSIAWIKPIFVRWAQRRDGMPTTWCRTYSKRWWDGMYLGDSSKKVRCHLTQTPILQLAQQCDW